MHSLLTILFRVVVLMFFPSQKHNDWDTEYKRELQTFLEYGDPGEVWFGEESTARLLTWLQKQKVPLDASILDIGTGNGLLLVEMAKSGYTNLTGIDYSEAAIELSQSILEKEDCCRSIKLKIMSLDVPSSGMTPATLSDAVSLTGLEVLPDLFAFISPSFKFIGACIVGILVFCFMVADFLSAPEELLGFDLCVDKGTLDAISLDPNCAAEKQQEYLASLRSVLKDNGHFVITSCNWTREELICQLAEGFTFLEELPTPKFSFGGRTGSSVTALVFQKKH